MSEELKDALRRIEKLEKENLALKEIEEQEDKKIKVSFSKATEKKLEECVNIKRNFIVKNKFIKWFDFNYNLSEEEVNLLKNLIERYGDFLNNYKEETLKAHFVIPILNQVNFLLFEYECSGLYEEDLTYETDRFIFTGTTDFVVSKGLVKAEKPYFFIQEFKSNNGDSYVEHQLVAELIAGVELNNWKEIKGCYIKGTNWNFVILEKLGENRYQYFVSREFLSTNINDLKDIFKNLLFVKNEIFEMVKKEIEEEIK